MKKKVLIALFVVLALTATASLVWAGGIDDPEGFPLYVIIEVTWNGDPDTTGSWTVWGPRWNPVVGPGGTVLASCEQGDPTCLDMSYYSTFAAH